MNNFFYEDPAGEGITVYHIDIGQIAMDHDEFKTDSKARRETIEVNLDKKIALRMRITEPAQLPRSLARE